MIASARLALLALEVAQKEDQIVDDADLFVQDAFLRRIEGESGFGKRTWARVDGERLRLDYKASCVPEMRCSDFYASPSSMCTACSH